ncbi:MAG: DUF4013 domain-containing protein [Anaerolineae bacterium]
MDVSKSLGYVFEDRDWLVKVLVGGVVCAIPVINLAGAGYGVRLIRNVAAGEERPLPEWSAFGEYSVQGLLVFVALAVYWLPLLMLNGANSVLNSFAGLDNVGYAIAGLISALSCLQSLYSLLLSLWLPAAVAHFAATGELVAFFQLDRIWGLISRHSGDYVVAVIVAAVASIVAALVGLALCVVGVVFTTFVAALVLAHLLGQILRADAQLAIQLTAGQ